MPDSPDQPPRPPPHFGVEELRRALARRQVPAPPPSPAAAPRVPARPAPVLYSRHGPRPAPPAAVSRPPPAGPALTLAEALPGGVERAQPPHGYLYELRRPVATVRGAAHVSAHFQLGLGNPASGFRQQLDLAGAPAALVPEDVIFLDLETTGLGSSPLFLIGTMLWEDGGLVVHQFLARDYAEEAAVIACYARLCANRRLLVTFNGKTFDQPYVRTRAAATGVPFQHDPVHLDMLHVARRLWRKTMPNCKLQTLETFLCRRSRQGDIPGSAIPEAYHAFVRDGNARQLGTILEHNVLDLVTLAELCTKLPRR